MKKRILLLILTILVMILATNCSGGMSNPAQPGDLKNFPDIPSRMSSLPVGVSDWDSIGKPSGGMGLLGLFELSLDVSKATAELTSLRQGALTDTLEAVDITNFLQMAPCTDCAKIKSVALDPDGHLVVSIGIKHPFDAGDPLKPITARNRADLHVFNVEGIVISDLAATTFPALDESTADFELINNGGYTKYLDAVLDDIFPTEATIHPYVMHFDDYSAGNFDPGYPMGFESVTTPPPSGNLVMAMGCDYDFKDYIFDLPSSEIVNFIYAVGCTYPVASESKSNRFEPEYRIPQHNKKAASEVSIQIISNNLGGGDISSTAEIEVRVVDINHGVPVGDELNQMFADSSVNDIFIEIPGVMTDMLILDGSSPISGTGHDPSDPLVYAGTVTNTAGAVEGTYSGLIKVLDSYAPGQNNSPLLHGEDGIKRVDPLESPLAGLFDIPEFATYQIFSIGVGSGNEPPVAILTSNPDPARIAKYTTIDLDATSSYDADGSIELYEFDFDWDGIDSNFNADASNTTGIITTPPFDEAGTFIVGLRVTDNASAVAYDSITVEVEEGCIIFVDDDNTAGPWDGTPSHPYQYVQDGVNAAPSDCTVWIKPGVYNEDPTGPPNGGDAEVTISNLQNLTLHGEDLPRIVMHGCLVNGRAAIHAYDSAGLRIEGVECTMAYHYQSMIWLENCDDATVDKCKITPNQTGCHELVRATYSDNLIISNNTYDDQNSHSSASNFVVLNWCDNALITCNTCRRQTHNGYNIYHTYMSNINLYNCSNAEISKNIMGERNRSESSSEYNQLVVINIYYGSNNTVRNNLIYDYSFYDSAVGSSSKNWAFYVNNSPEIKIYNNTIDSFGPDGSGLGETYGIHLDGTSDAELYNNIITNLASTTSGTCYGVYSNTSATQTYSDVWNLTGGTTYRYADSASEGTGGIDVNPMFMNPSSYDYHLQTGSPCKGTGLNGDDMGCYGGSDPLP